MAIVDAIDEDNFMHISELAPDGRNIGGDSLSKEHPSSTCCCTAAIRAV